MLDFFQICMRIWIYNIKCEAKNKGEKKGIGRDMQIEICNTVTQYGDYSANTSQGNSFDMIVIPFPPSC